MPRTTDVTVEVSQEMIDSAKRNESNACMVVVGIQHKFPTATHVSVDIHTIRMTIPEDQKRYIYLTPGEAQKYIFAFDEQEEIKPFSFYLREPAWIADAVSHGGGDKPQKSVAVVRRNPKGKGKETIQVEATPPPERNPRQTGRRIKGLRAVRGWDINPDFKP